tara:strand:+ start:198 stop:1433 length:1236 start_codon:yes stop_codon:yes gene_type:complete
MGKVDLGTTKYIIKSKIEASGVIERPDVVGAIFGQTEGLLGNDLDLRELQKTGRIGRIEVTIESKLGKSKGSVNVPSSLDKVETAILAAALETIDRVGPCEAKVVVKSIADVRILKRTLVIDRAKNILATMVDDITPDSLEITEEVKESVRLAEILKFGKDRLPAGPNVQDSDGIIVVEGRADVLNLLKHGIKNAIAVEGTNIPPSISELSSKKTVIAFLDGDRGGDLILRELLQVADIDFVARAPDGKEVEDLTKKELFKGLRNKAPAEQSKENAAKNKSNNKPVLTNNHGKVKSPQKPIPTKISKKPKLDKNVPKFKNLFNDLTGTLKAYLLDSDAGVIKEVAVRDLAVALQNSKENVSAVIFDGVVTQRLVDISRKKSVKYLVGAKVGNVNKIPSSTQLLTVKDLSHA